LLLPVVAVRDTSPRQRQGIAETLSNDSGIQMPPLLWPHCNETFVPATEPRISIYVKLGVFLALPHRGGTFSSAINFRTRKPQCANACGFFNGGGPTENGLSAGCN